MARPVKDLQGGGDRKTTVRIISVHGIKATLRKQEGWITIIKYKSMSNFRDEPAELRLVVIWILMC